MHTAVGTVLKMSDDSEFRPTPILVAGAERERSIVLLRIAVGEGRLPLEEFSERVGLADAASTDMGLASLAGDLPNGEAVDPACIPNRAASTPPLSGPGRKPPLGSQPKTQRRRSGCQPRLWREV